MFDVLGVDSRQRDASGGEQVNVVLVNQDAALLLRQSGVRKHPDLVRNVVPRS